MDNRDLMTELERLRAEIDAADGLDDARRHEMLETVARLERDYGAGGADEDLSLVEQVEEYVTEFEASHPTLSGVLNDILFKLSNMGV